MGTRPEINGDFAKSEKRVVQSRILLWKENLGGAI